MKEISLAGLFLLIGAVTDGLRQTLDGANKIVEETFGSDLRTFTGMTLAEATIREVTDSGGGPYSKHGPSSMSMGFFDMGTDNEGALKTLEASGYEIEIGFKPSYAAGPPPVAAFG